MSTFNESNKVWMEQQVFDAVYSDGDNGTNAMEIAHFIIRDFSDIIKTDAQVKEIVEMVVTEQGTERDYIAIYTEAYSAMFEDDAVEHWTEYVESKIADGFVDAEDIYNRIFDVSDWSENGFNIPQVDGIFDGVKEITVSVWNDNHKET